MTGTRLRILQILQRNSTETVDGLSRAIGLASATVRRHLDILQRDGLVSFAEVRKKTGRPQHSFHLTDQGQEALPKGYDRMLGLIIGQLALLTSEDTKSRNGGQILLMVFQQLSEQVSREHAAEVDGKDLEHRLHALMRLLQREKFSPEAEIIDGMLRIKLLNCPFRSTALQNNAVCAYDSTLISAVLNMDVRRCECIQDGHSCCTYSAYVGPSAPALDFIR